MKRHLTHFKTSAAMILLAVTGLLFFTGKVSAQIFASDDAAPYTGWQTGTNFGFGFQPWVLEQTGTGGGNYTGFYLGKPTDPIASTNGNVWGIYANGIGGTNASEAFRDFSNSLPVNATFKVRWHNTGIGNSTTKVGGFNLRNGTSTNLMTAATFLNDGTRFALYYIGGISDNFTLYDGNGANSIPLNFASSPFQVELTLLPGDLYNLAIKNTNGTTVLYSTAAQPLAGSGTIDSVALYAFQTDGDQIFNDLGIFYTPPQVANLQPTNGAIYVNAGATQLSFDVLSLASTVASNQIQLTLNGTVQTRANWTVSGTGTSSNHVVLNTPLQDNITYAGTVIATDVNGNSTTNNFTFNTWLASNPFIEAEDYNFGGGRYIDNFLAPQPNQAYQGLIGTNLLDYLEYDLSGTNNLYRPGDLPQVEAATDVDHDNFANNAFQDYDLAFIQNGEWEDYTRRLSNVTYTVYARMAGFGNSATMLIENLAVPTVTSTNQPRASLGTFVCPNTGGPQNWTFVPLQDFFSNPVQIRLAGTNTCRLTDIGGDGNYNVNYLILVPNTNTDVLHPYIASGFPYPGVGGVGPDQNISFVIANPSTNPVVPGSIQLFLNSSNVTSGIVVSNNNAGAAVSYQLAGLLPPGANTLEAIYSDGLVSITNQWQFTVATLPVIPPADAQPLGPGFAPGFAEQIAKGDDGATNADFPPHVARAEAQLAGTLTNSITGLPYANEALNGGIFTETNVINYAIDPLFFGLLSPTNLFPDIPAGGTNNIALAAQMYVQLAPGAYTFGVYSDDGFKFTAGATPADTNLVLGIADYGRAPSETAFSFIIETNGLYPMRLLFFKSQFNGGGVQLYSINRSNGTRILLNDPANVNSIKAYYLASVLPIPLNIQKIGGNVVLTWSDASFALQSAPLVTGVYTNVTGASSPYTNVITGVQQYFRLKH